MISEIPVVEETQEIVQETPVETVAEKDESISADLGKSPETVKRKPGRPKKEIEKVEKVEKPKPPPKPKAKTRVPKENVAPANTPANTPEIIQPLSEVRE